jgi:hypothetical protein
MVENDNCFHDAIIKIKELVNKYKDEDFIEIEYRLGYMGSDKFKTDIGKESYNKIMKELSSLDTWDEVLSTHSEDYFLDGVRMSVMSNEQIVIKKEKLAILDFSFEGTGLDIRVSFSKELPAEPFKPEDASFKRIKDRKSFLINKVNPVSYDITKITYINNSVEDYTYEFEIEWLGARTSKETSKETGVIVPSSYYSIHDCLLKIKDIVNLCEEMDDNCKLKLKETPIADSGLLQVFVSQHMMDNWKYAPGDNAWVSNDKKIKVNDCIKVKTVAFRINSNEITALGNIV